MSDLSPCPARANDLGVRPVPIRILIVSLNFPPDLIGAARYNGDFVVWLMDHGFDVEVVTAPPYYPAWRLGPWGVGWRYRRETFGSATVTRCPLWVRPHLGGVGRLFHLMSFAATSAPVLLWRALMWRPDVVFVVYPTLFAVPAALVAARLVGAHLWLHVQDFEVDAAFALGLLRNRLVGWLARRVEAVLMTVCDIVSSLTPGMLGRVAAKGVPQGCTHLLPNWINPQEIQPSAEAADMRAELGYGADDVVILYAGNMGNKQGLEILIDAARLTVALPHLRYLLVGDGLERIALEAEARGLDTVRFSPLVPADRLNALMGAADIHVLPQRVEADGLMMPSKLSTMMASGRPVVVGAAADSEVAKAMEGCGLVVPPGSSSAFANALRTLAGAPELRRALGNEARLRAITLWDREIILTDFERRIQSLVSKPGKMRTGASADQSS